MRDERFKAVLKQCLPTYDIMGTLGQGIHGSVFLVKDNLKERAVKVVPIHVERSTLFREDKDLDSRVSRDFHAVCRYYEKVKGPDVVTVHDFHLVDKKISNGYAEAFLVILMARLKGNLQDLVLEHHPLAPGEVLRYAKELAAMMGRLSRVSGETFLLTDFKPSNLLIGEAGSLVMGDLGGLKRVSSVSSTVGGAQFTPNWSAPELILKGEKPDEISGIYSLGLVLYYLCEGRLPHEDADFIERLGLVRKKGAGFVRRDLPPAFVSVVEKCLSFERGDRFSDFEAVHEALDGKRGVPSKEKAFFSQSSFLREGRAKRETPRPLVTEGYSGISFVWIPEGHLTLRGKGQPHREFVPGFYMATTAVTQAQWRKVMQTNPSHFPRSAEHPVEMVTFKEALSFCERLSQRAREGFHVILPHEAQWLYAAQGGDESQIFAGGDELDGLGWFLDNGSFSTHAVGEKTPNGYGLFDMCGNVQEWCDGAISTLLAPHPESRDQVVRGGSWNQSAGKCTLEARRIIAEGLKYSNLGFRVAMVSET